MLVKKLEGARLLALLLVATMVASCGLPRPGPTRREVDQASVQRQGDAFVVPVTDSVVRATSSGPSEGFSAAFKNAGLIASDIVSPGDLLHVSVYENVQDPLLGARGQKVSQLATIKVDNAGDIFVPYAGRIKAAGKSIGAVRLAITRKLDTQTPDPQVSVVREPGDGATVTVEGAVTAQGVYPINRSTRTLAAMLAQAKGVTISPDSALVSVTRGRRMGKIWLKALYDNPRLDIALRPGDRITVEQDDRTFTALGATGQQASVTFDTPTISAIEAIARVGGLNSMTADPKGVFVFRKESAAVANAVLGRQDLVGPQRMIYVLDLTKPTGMFAARDFMIRDGDTVYVTEAPFVQWQKTIAALTGSATGLTSLQAAGAQVKKASGL